MHTKLLCLSIIGLIFAPTISYSMNTLFKTASKSVSKVRVTPSFNDTSLRTFPWAGSDAQNAGKGLLGGLVGGGILATGLFHGSTKKDSLVTVQNVALLGWPFSLLTGGPAGVVSFLGTAVVLKSGLSAQKKYQKEQGNLDFTLCEVPLF